MNTKQQKKLQPKRELRQLKKFSETVKKSIVADIEKGKCTILKASRELCVSQQAIYQWVYRYSRYLQKNKVLIVEEKSEMYKTQELEQKLREAEAALGRKQMEIDFLSKLIEIASKELKVDIKKNFFEKQCSGSGDKK